MFVRQSKYDALLRAAAEVERQRQKATRLYNALNERWNKLVEEINDKGGRQFLDRESLQFDAEDIRLLIYLCHPDKHNSSVTSTKMTAKLLALKETIK